MPDPRAYEFLHDIVLFVGAAGRGEAAMESPPYFLDVAQFACNLIQRLILVMTRLTNSPFFRSGAWRCLRAALPVPKRPHRTCRACWLSFGGVGGDADDLALVHVQVEVVNPAAERQAEKVPSRLPFPGLAEHCLPGQGAGSAIATQVPQETQTEPRQMLVHGEYTRF